MHKDRNRDSPILNKNRGRFYSHQIGNEHLKAVKVLNRTNDGSVGKNDTASEFDITKYLEKTVHKDPNELLDGISDMFINNDLNMNFENNNSCSKKFFNILKTS